MSVGEQDGGQNQRVDKNLYIIGFFQNWLRVFNMFIGDCI